MSEITKEELLAFTEAHAKSAVALESIANRLLELTAKQDKLIDKLTNGMSESIVEGVTDNYNTTHKETIASLTRVEESLKDMPAVFTKELDNSKIAKNVERAAWFIGIIGIAVIIVTVIVRGVLK